MIKVCKDVSPRLVVKRARFSALIARDLQRAVSQLQQPNQHESDAVEARQEIDLRIGASFTRYQTLLLQNRFVFEDADEGARKVVSYGPCQFPTLGLIVMRHWYVQPLLHIAAQAWP